MLQLEACKPKLMVPVYLALLAVAQIDLASAAAWPMGLLQLLHLTPAGDDTVRGFAAGIGFALDVVAVYQLARIYLRRAAARSHGPEQD